MKKKILSMVISLVMAFSFAGVMPKVEIKVEANCTANQILAVAQGEIGTKSGYHQRNKYTLWNGTISGYADGGYGYPWCATFVSWCANQSGCLDIIKRTAGCNVQWAQTSGTKYFVSSGYKPKAGDIIFFDYGTSHSANSLDHVGIVESFDGTTVYTIEGNYDNSVARVARKYNSNDIYGFIAPNYNNILSEKKPTWANLHTENYIMNYNVNENITFNATSDYATEYYLNIDKDGQRLYCEQMTNGRLTITLKECGYYTACVTARNSQGWVDSKYIGVRILQPANVGDNRNVYIKNVGNGLLLTNNNNAGNGNTGNVSGSDIKLTKNQLWTLIKQNDGSYRIKNAYDNQCLEVFQAGTTNGTNISVYTDTVEFINQNFYIYNLFDAYYIKPVCSDLFVDMSFENPYNVATYGYADNWDHQKFIFIDESDAQLICSHSYSSWTTSKSATCTADGSKTRKCSVCNKSETQTITKLGHSLGNWTTKNATCTADGSKTRSCTRSGCTHKETQTIAKTGHDYITEKISASYTEDGYTKHTCKTCGDSFKDNFVKKPKGDMNNDGNVMIADVVMIQRCLTKTIDISTEQVIAADLNEDGKFNVFDLIIVKRIGIVKKSAVIKYPKSKIGRYQAA